MPGIIYALAERDTGEIRYCGKTVRSLNHRLNAHKADAVTRKVKRHVCNWLRPIYESGDTPKAIVCETISFDGLSREQQLSAINAAEQWWIAELRSMGFALTNHTDGGDGHHGFRMPEESLARTRAAHIGAKRSEEAKARMSAAQQARDPSTRYAPQSGKPLGKEHREALLAGARAYNSRPEVRAALAQKMSGNKCAKRKITDEQVKQIYRSGGSHQSIANNHGVSRGFVSMVKRGERHRYTVTNL